MPDDNVKQRYDFSAFAEDAAEACGCVVVYPASNQIQLDLDSDEAFSNYEKRLKEFYSRVPGADFHLLKEPVVTPSKSGLPHRHITLTFHKEFSETERICMQVMLGSDPVRESLNALRMFTGIEKPTRLFEPKQAVRP